MSRLETVYKFIFFALLAFVPLGLAFGCSSSSPTEPTSVVGESVSIPTTTVTDTMPEPSRNTLSPEIPYSDGDDDGGGGGG